MNKRIYLSPPHMSGLEQEFIQDVFQSNWIAPLGPHVDAFELEMAEKVGVAHASALSSGTAALHLALIMLGIQKGDLVLTSSLTFSSTANAIKYCGAEPVFIDSSTESWNMAPALLAEEIENLVRAGNTPKAVITVDIYGQCTEYDLILESCHKHNIPVIEDSAEALGASYKGKNAGSFGEMAILSFNGNKIITTSGGGMLLSNNDGYINRARFLATQARDPEPHYQHSEIGYNYRMSNLLAAVGRGQLRVLDDRVRRKREINKFYRNALADEQGITFMPEAPNCKSTFWLTCIQVDPIEFGATREDIRLALEDQNIESRPVWKPMHMQPVFKDCRFVGSGVCEELFEKGLCLSSGTAMTQSDLNRIVETIKNVPRKKRRSKV